MFKQTDLLNEQVDAHLNHLRRKNWLTFKGADAVNLLRRVIHLRAATPPILVAHCHRQLHSEPNDYGHFIPHNFNYIQREHRAIIAGTIGENGEPIELVFDPNRPADPSGLFLSSISTLASFYPKEAIEAIEIPAIKF